VIVNAAPVSRTRCGMTNNDRRVAVIGAGPAGLIGARFLKARGFEPVLFDRSRRAGGQWDQSSAASGIWPDMRANTSGTLTRFSDLDYPAGTAAFPHSEQVRAYLETYAARFGLLSAIRFGTTIEQIVRDRNGGYVLTTTDAAGAESTGTFARVVIASGRYNSPSVPAIHRLETFSGRGGVTHAFNYKASRRLAGARVLVAGGSISALEIASELARLGAARVAIAMRRQRYVVPKLIAGVPADNIGFTRFGALAGETFAPDAIAAALKAFLIEAGGNPALFGAAPQAPCVRPCYRRNALYFNCSQFRSF
jgi:dimethylaniline monooxygenase (N-oxide forming)